MNIKDNGDYMGTIFRKSIRVSGQVKVGLLSCVPASASASTASGWRHSGSRLLSQEELFASSITGRLASGQTAKQR